MSESVASQSIEHYENFPVASWLCPPHLRPAITALYHFARTADDLADEGDAAPEQRLADLTAYRDALKACLNAAADDAGAIRALASSRWPQVFKPLAGVARQHHMPAALLHRLLDAFEQDVRHTANGHRYSDAAELLRYCDLSANPVGRLLLHLYGVTDDNSLRMSDQICSGLQLVNFWQDLSVDLPRQRHYLPADVLRAHQLNLDDVITAHDAPQSVRSDQRAALNQTVAELCAQARTLMQAGAPLALRLPGRMGWELRLVVQGGLRILDKIEDLHFESWHTRPSLSAWDAPRLFWRAWRMR